jgi:DNA-binding transcriptional ArsR family regulator
LSATAAKVIEEAQAELFRALAHPFRLQLLEMLGAEEVCVCHLVAYSGKPQPYVSKHLAELRDAGIVIDRREGQRVYYRLTDPALRTVLDGARRALARRGLLPAQEATTFGPRFPVPGCECPRCATA